MKWNHLPLDGGLYAQHPKLIDQFRFIFAARAAHEAKKQETEERKRRSEARSPGRVAGRGRARR